MPAWDREDLIAQCRLQVRRPDVDADFEDTDWDIVLSQAQDHWVRQIAQHAPKAMYNAFPGTQLVSSDGGVTWVLSGVTEIIGMPELRSGVRGVVLSPEDYILEMSAGEVYLRFPLGSATSFDSGGPYMRYIAPPARISSSQEPVLKPESARILMVYDACARYARRPGVAINPAAFEEMCAKEWYGDPRFPGELGILDTLKLQYAAGDMELSEAGDAWWQSQDFGRR